MKKKDDVPKLPIGRAEDKIFKKFLVDSEDEIRSAYIDAIVSGKGILHINRPVPNVLTMKCVSQFQTPGLVQRLVSYMMRPKK